MLTESFTRAELSRGISNDYIYRSIERELEALPLDSEAVLVDIGSGRGNIEKWIRKYFVKVIGVDAVRHEGWPAEDQLVIHDLNTPGIDLPDGCADVVMACEVLPQVESPRLVVRECVRLCKPGGWVIVHAPNVLTFLSYLALLLRRRFVHFQDGSADFMITPLLESDIVRMFRENGLQDVKIFYTKMGRLPFTGARVPQWISRRFPRLFSDNLGVIGRKPSSQPDQQNQ